jgi:hypothetical protein
MARVILHAFEPERDYMNSCEFAKNPQRKSSERHAINNNMQQDFTSENYSTYQIVPNPNNGKFNLRCPDNEQFSYTIYDSKGSIINKGNAKSLGYIFSMDLPNLSNGIYNLIITNSTYQRVSVKFNIIH